MTALAREQLVSLVLAAAEDLNDIFEDPIDLSAGADALLYGDRGPLQSMDLVSLVIAVEQLIEDESGTLVSLTDERAMSQKSSPFRSVESLATYAHTLLEES